ncbi:siroheme synthase CysG [Litorimonas sp. RW-G-Af-16]|uniref:siroheme synthase CysG n=1 Tax=Litorimonas sp. RW-G-Af-16 TaxID=3241168 RepID=UPI00390C80B7
MRYLPIHIDTHNARILIVGGGEAAEAKLRTLLKTEAELLLISPNVGPEVARWIEDGKISHLARDFHEQDLEGVTLVYAATEDGSLNAEIAAKAASMNLPVNAADQKDACSFITPALVDRAPMVISIGSEGTSPGLSRAIKSDLETRLPSTLGRLALKTQELRAKVKELMPELSDRQRFWARVFDGKDLTAHLKLDEAGIEDRVDEALTRPDADKGGSVVLVGAGPGNPDLLTFAARQALHSADVVVYDRLVSQDVLDLARREAEYIYVGKEPGGKSTPQDEINQVLIDKARKGFFVVRLKSGDPLIFGRADEELDALEAAAIPTSIIPGITSAASAAAEIGASLTTRGKNKAISLLTGHDAKGFAEQDWKSLAAAHARAAVYMGVGASRFIQGRLLIHGAEHSRPVTVVENASRPNQKIVATTLGALPDDLEAAGIKGPAILLIGYAPRDAARQIFSKVKHA